MRRLGWKPNLEKCDLSPTCQTTFVGFDVNSNTVNGPWIKVLPAKVRKLRRSIVNILKTNMPITARMLAWVAGQCVAMSRAIVPGKLLLRNVYRVIATKQTWDSIVVLSQGAYKDLCWWLDAFKSWNGALLITKKVDVQIATDASSLGWGATILNSASAPIKHVNLPSVHAAGTWHESTACMHSNFRELLAILKAIVSFRNSIKGLHVQILSDNATSVAYINHLRGSSELLSTLMTTIWSTADAMNVTLSAQHLAGWRNSIADGLSRISSPYNWQLNTKIFKNRDRMWGPHTVDRFAADHNTHLPVYNSLHWDPKTSGIDAMSQKDWYVHNNYVNAPFWLLNKVISVIQDQKAHATVIAPLWQGQPWAMKLRQLSVSPPIEIKNTRRSFYSRITTPEPLKNPKWRIFAWRLCGNTGCSHWAGRKQQQ